MRNKKDIKKKPDPPSFDYWLWPKYFNPPDVQGLRELVQKNIHGNEEVGKGAVTKGGEQLKFLKTRQVYLHKLRKFLQPVFNSIYYINDREFQYDLFRSFENFEMANYNVYSSKTKDHYGWHIDSSHNGNYDTKFTVLINLSAEPYKGGDFMYFNQEPIRISKFRNPGSVLMFKSYLNHKVTSVTSGERITLTIFMHGPRFK